MTEPETDGDKVISSKVEVGGEKTSKSSSRSGSKKEKERTSVSGDDQGTGGKVGKAGEDNTSKKGRASADKSPDTAERDEKGGESNPKSKKDRETKNEIKRRDKEAGVENKSSSKKRRRSSVNTGGETGEEHKEPAETKKSKSSSKKTTKVAREAKRKENGTEVEQQQSTTISAENCKKDRAVSISDERTTEKHEKEKGKDADESNSKPKSKSRKHSSSTRGSIGIDGQGDSATEGDTGGQEKGGGEREVRRKDSKSSNSKKKKERRSSKTSAASSRGGPEPEAVPEALNAAGTAVASEEASKNDKPKHGESKEKSEKGFEAEKRRESKKEKEKDGEADRSYKKKERRRSSASRKEKQKPSPNKMQPGESNSLGSKSAGEAGGDGFKPVGSEAAPAAATVLVPDAKVQEGGDTKKEQVRHSVTPVTDKALDATAAKGEALTKESRGGDFSDGTTAAKASVSTAAAVVGTESPSNNEPKGGPEETSTATGAKTIDEVAGGLGAPGSTPTSIGGPGDAPPTDDVSNPETRPRENGESEASKTPTEATPKKKVILSGSGTTLPASVLVTLDATAGARVEEAPTDGVLAERKVAENGTAEDTGGAAARGGTVSPTPPRTRSNPIGRGTPPQRGSRGGNLAICTQQPYSPGHEDGRDRPKPTSPRSRPRDQPLVSAKNDARGGGGGGGVGANGGSGSGDDEDAAREDSKGKVASFSSRRWKASDEYVLDEDRETPRGGVFAKIPGLDQHLMVEPKKMNDPPRCRPPKLISGTVRMYGQEEAGGAAFRYPECRGAVFRPSYADDGSLDDLPASSPLLSEPPQRLRLERAHGYHGGGFYPSTDINAYFLGENHMPNGGSGRGGSKDDDEGLFEVMYPTAALVIMQQFRVRDGVEGKGGESGGQEEAAWEGQSDGGDRESGEMMQRFFDGHTDDVTAVAVHPGGVLVASGQVGRNPDVLVWTSSAECGKDDAVLNKKKAIIATLRGHERKICCLDFSPDGWLLCSVGADCKSTTKIWDWRKGVAVATVRAGPGPIHAFRFNPYQSYGVPSKKPVPGQALHMDDACYCLVSIGVRHSKFWLLTRGLEGPARDEILPVVANAKWTSSQRVQEERAKEVKGRGDLRWIIDGSSARLNGKGTMADFTCVTFIDDSPPLQTWGANNTVVDCLGESDRSSGRVVLGTATGDLYIFIQRGVRLIPREFAKNVKRGKGGKGIFLDPWWLFGPGHEVTANKRLWDLGAELVDNIPHSKEAANELVLSDKAKDRVRALEQKMAVKPLHPAVFEELKRQHDRSSYTGPLTGHDGGVSALAFNRETGKVVSAGTNGEIVQWQAFFFDPTTNLVSPARRASGAPNNNPTPAPGTPLKNNSLVGLINERRNRNEEKIQRSLRSRNPADRTLRRVGHEAPRGDGRVGGVDVFEMDYRTTLGREDEGELSLSGLGPSSLAAGRDEPGRSSSRIDMFGVSGRSDGFESSGTTRGSLERSASGDKRRGGSKNHGNEEGSEESAGAALGGVGIRFEAGAQEAGLRVELDLGGARQRSGEKLGLERRAFQVEGEAVEEEERASSTPHGGGRDQVSRKRSVSLPRGSHGKSLVWSKDGKRLLTGVNTNILLLLEYRGDDRETSSDRRVGAVSPRGRSVSPQQHQTQSSSCDAPRSNNKPSVRRLVQGHSGSVMALAVFTGMHEYVTAGYDRSVAVWNAASNLPIAWCGDLPSPVACLACSPDLEEVAVGTVNTNEILFLKVHRGGRPGGAAPSSQEEGGGVDSAAASDANPATRIELHHSKQLLPASAWAKRRQPGLNSRWITTAPSWDRCQIVTLDGKDTPHVAVGGAASNGGAGGGGAAAPHKSNSTSKMSPLRTRARSASLGDMGHVGGDPSTPPRLSPSRPRAIGGGPGSGEGGGAGSRTGEHGGRRGRRRYSDGGEPQRGMGATCMRYSPSGSHLAIGCKNGSLVIMAVEAPDASTGGRTADGHDDGLRHTGPGGSGRPEGGLPSGEEGKRSAELSTGVGGGDDSGGGVAISPPPRRQRQGRRKVYRRIAHLKGHSSRVLHLDWTVDGRFVHTCGQDYHILHWEILPPPPHRRDEGAAEEGALNDDSNGGDETEAVTGEFRPRMFKRAFLVRDEQWATWSSTIGWPVQGVFPAYSDNSDVNAVDVCLDHELLAAADDAKTIRLLRYPVLRGGARNRSYTAHSSHVMGARFTVGVEPTRLITLGGVDSTVMQWVVENEPG